MAKQERDPKVLQIDIAPDADKSRTLARVTVRPTVNAAMTTQAYAGVSKLDLTALMEELDEQTAAVNNGDLKRAESLLISQAHTLDAIFNNLAKRALINLGEYIGTADTYLKLALRAQNQCRTTLQTLGELKNPQPVAFVKQANISNGPQQVNNGVVSSPTASHVQENQIRPNELLEALPSERLDTRAPSTTSGVDSPVEAVGAFAGPEV